MLEVRTRPMILIVDDDEAYLGDVEVLLSAFYDVHTIMDSLDALSAIEDSTPDCILLDIQMPAKIGTDPDREGLAFLAALNRKFSNRPIPVIVASSCEDPDTLNRALELGVKQLIRKPPNINKLIELINRAIENK